MGRPDFMVCGRLSLKQRPRILRILSRMAVGGVQNGVLNTLKRSNPRLYDYTVLCTKKAGKRAAEIEALRIPVIPCKTLPPWDPYQIWRLSRTIRRISPDLVHVHMAPTVIPGVAASRLAGVKRIIIQHHSDYTRYWSQMNGLLRAWEWSMTRRIAGYGGLVCVSKTVAKATAGQLGLDPACLKVIPNGVDLDVFRPDREGEDPRVEWQLDPGTPLVYHVSRYLESKRIDDFMEAASIVTRRWKGIGPSPAFINMGGGPAHLELFYEHKLSKYDRAVRIRLEGERLDLARLLPWGDVGVMASENEGCPNTILEYMAAGLPMAVTDIPPILELLRAGQDALVSAPRDAGALADNIEELLRNRDRSRSLRGSAIQWVRQYDWSAAAQSYEKLYACFLQAP